MTEYYERKLRDGRAYEEFVAEQLRKRWGKTVELHATQQAQLDHGDLRVDGVDVEVKFDERMQEPADNLYIEVAEKRQVGNARFVDSGIFARSSAEIYLIGDYHRGYWFRRDYLRGWLTRNRPRVFVNNSGLGRGFLIEPSQRAVMERQVFIWDGVKR